ncbi:hypothetical protein AB4G91_02700 [Macrococcoides goetzii]|uniref:hypothetical protein n=1 Tax=Macrococcus sp. PK TaxID=2801919 RepID=UPI001F10AA74|nr:hypothetical protein [Macrococcus sp. PK]MCH4984209.1 hypothetical protein [Macrococcus sp. PK]
MYKDLTEEQIERIKNRIEELDLDHIEDEADYKRCFEYYMNELLNGYLDEY